MLDENVLSLLYKHRSAEMPVAEIVRAASVALVVVEREDVNQRAMTTAKTKPVVRTPRIKPRQNAASNEDTRSRSTCNVDLQERKFIVFDCWMKNIYVGLLFSSDLISLVSINVSFVVCCFSGEAIAEFCRAIGFEFPNDHSLHCGTIEFIAIQSLVSPGQKYNSTAFVFPSNLFCPL